ncbi:carboxylesterase family protein [Aspergillus cavernicola]|uniref:Carboxylesterase family protein n=1 Tax=Aspergillus cavernicola TaxID=176166 RepID=A0ABR4II18_9EURO
MLILSLLFTLLVSAFASTAKTGINSSKHHDLPLLELPYGTWRAHHYNDQADVYTFRNIRYAAPPLGELRWAEPSPPKFFPDVQDGSYGHNCIPAAVPDSFDSPIFENITKNAAEDCLFLDVYVPGNALVNPTSSIPVVVWIHGGGFVTGSKDQAIEQGYFDGTSLIQRADDNLIVVSINYRLGGFGFLAGEPLQTHGVFNAGLHDQRAALAWVQSYIHLLGGDPSNVSAWGQSAGAGSLMYHLIAKGGELDPLFKRAILQSPAFGTNPDLRRHYQRFGSFAVAAGCEGIGIGIDALKCLRLANSSALRKANAEVFLWDASPVPDGKYIRNPALVEYSRGNTWKHLDSLIVSHVVDEGSLYVPDPLPSNFLSSVISGLLPENSTKQVQKIVHMYESLYANSSTKERASAVYRDLILTCNIRTLLTAYTNPTQTQPSSWALQYSFIDNVLNGTHGSDAPATWYNSELQGYTVPLFAEYQRYLTNHARTGNPNLPWSGEYELGYWPGVWGLDDGERPRGVFNFTNWGFGVIEDGQMLGSVCGVWIREFLEAVGLK